MTVGVTGFDPEFQYSESSADNSSSLTIDKDAAGLFITMAGANGGWGVKVYFNPSVLLLDDALLMSGGSRTTKTTATQQGVSYPAQFTMSVSPGGTVTVPAGTFYNCRNLTSSETATVPGYGTVTASAFTAVLAPGVGPIKLLVEPNVWAQLTGGSVGGVDVRNLASNAGVLPPSITAQPQNTTATDNLSAVFKVTATGGGLNYQWYKGSEPLAEGGRFTGTTAATLTINPVAFSDAGAYHMTVGNTACSVSSATAVLKVIADPTPLRVMIQTPPSNARVSNVVVQVSGQASDNIGVARVMLWANSGTPAAATGTLNWAGTVALVPGNNTISAQAFDLDTNASPMASVKVVYVLSDRVTLQTQPPGGGTISGVADQQWLEIGKSYQVNAAPRPGFSFLNWVRSTNGIDWITSNVPALTFTMQSNLVLVANFRDVQKPVLAIKTPTAGQKWSNAVFTVTGTASDNAAVTQVLVRLNSGNWQTAIGTSTWQIAEQLTPGTNTVYAYALDGAGNPSSTNTVTFTYVLTAPLSVQIVGNGTVTPNYNGQSLVIGQSYSMTATPAAGFAFSNWSGSGTTNKPTLAFVMASNLTFTATFVDVQKPTLTIKAPTAGQKWSNAVFTVTGTASDNVGVSQVLVKLNRGSWETATGTTA